MANVYIRFDGANVEIGHLARLALQPVLDSVYRGYRGMPQWEIEEVLRRAGRGSFSRDRIEIFARYIARGDRPVLTGAGRTSQGSVRPRR